MCDLISRQAAIDATSEIVFVEYEDDDSRKEESIILQTKAAIRDRIKALPPVYVPEINVGDMISKQAAMERLMAQNVIMDGSEYHNGFNAGVNRAQEVIRNLLPVRTEIIHCKDCKHWIPYDWMFSEVWQSQNMADYPEDEIGCNYCDIAMKANDFCSRAEKRGEADE